MTYFSAKPNMSEDFSKDVSGKENTNITIGVCYARGSSEESKVYWIDNKGTRYNGKSTASKDNNDGTWTVENTLVITGDIKQHQDCL